MLTRKQVKKNNHFDHVESGRAYIHWGMLSYLASFYDCKIKIDLEFCAEGDAAALEEWRRLKVDRNSILT